MQLCAFKQDLCLVFELHITLKIHMEEKNMKTANQKSLKYPQMVFSQHIITRTVKDVPAAEMVDGGGFGKVV